MFWCDCGLTLAAVSLPQEVQCWCELWSLNQGYSKRKCRRKCGIFLQNMLSKHLSWTSYQWARLTSRPLWLTHPTPCIRYSNMPLIKSMQDQISSIFKLVYSEILILLSRLITHLNKVRMNWDHEWLSVTENMSHISKSMFRFLYSKRDPCNQGIRS